MDDPYFDDGYFINKFNSLRQVLIFNVVNH